MPVIFKKRNGEENRVEEMCKSEYFYGRALQLARQVLKVDRMYNLVG